MYGRRGKAVIFIAPLRTYPRFYKRIEAFQKRGFQIYMFAFRRKMTQIADDPNVTYIDLGELENRKYLRRMFTLTGAIRKIWRYRGLFKKSQVRYYFNLDCAFLGLLVAMGRRDSALSIYEVGDLRKALTSSGVSGLLLRPIESLVISIMDILILTSRGFYYEHYYKRGVPIEKVLFVENKLSLRQLPQKRPEPVYIRNNSPVTIGLIGHLRFEREVQLLLDYVATAEKRCRLLVYGEGPLRPLIESKARRYSNVRYFGPFDYRNISNIYGSIDLNYVVYDNTLLNVRVALPNKLYESVFFGRPLVVAKSTELAKCVRNWNVGFVVDASNSATFSHFFETLTSTEINLAGQNCLLVEDNKLIDVDELAAVFKRLKCY